MNNTVIQVDRLSKLYHIGHSGKIVKYKTLRETITGAFSAPLRCLRKNSKDQNIEIIWALKDVSFEIQDGEVVGIIGHNGAGKSTLLKILSRITEPSEGTVDIYGRVGSLLEVGSGFHNELTGRENIFLNGAILGMKKAEIEKKFDEIVDFSGVEKFIDTPVKHYSNGMYLRLAFSVAAHLEPDILLVDEVLAVGDAEFQKRCLGKMSDVANAGRTVLFVSHQMAAIQNLCKRTILLDNGKILMDGDTESVIKEYMNSSIKRSQISLSERPDRTGSGEIRFSKVTLKNREKEPIDFFRSGDYAVLAVEFEHDKIRELHNLNIALGIDDSFGQRITVLSTEVTHETFQIVSPDSNCVEIHIERLPLAPGRYGFTLFATVDGTIADWIKNAGFFDVESGDYFGTGKMLPVRQGNFLVDHHFKIVECLSNDNEKSH
jgi:lipopolysaccharide transport system ATP-binding protein